MPQLLTLISRTVVLIAHAVWVGGFTFYSTAVLWVLDDELGTFDAGRLITRRVTDWMNAAGVATLALWWGLTWIERRAKPRLPRRIRLGLVLASTLLLGFLIVDHLILDHHLDTKGRAGFYAMHSVYLIAATIQWVANLLLIPASLWVWRNDSKQGLLTTGPL